MQPRINILTLAVDDLEKAHAFYRDGLGLPSQGILGTEFTGDEKNPAGAVAFFELQGGLVFALYPRVDLAKDANRSVGSPSAAEFSLGYLVGSKAKVDTLLQRAAAAGGTITEPPHSRPWGIYSGYFQDLDGHLWEVIWNPGLPVED
jgi:catechol 2,3-dioxygenase-like lactoylglutathione lyase family enzyme